VSAFGGGLRGHLRGHLGEALSGECSEGIQRGYGMLGLRGALGRPVRLGGARGYLWRPERLRRALRAL
jgi:hypothetical protein